MNGRVFTVNRSPVLAWNVEPQLQVPYPDMPAAAAISPIVPAASDPYGRCWQNQVDAGTSFPYFGALYNSSLPPSAYRLQPGCMANLGQFWPPTPPPDGCGRFDGSNLYFSPSILRTGDNVRANTFQGLGHYSHLVETSKESNQRVFKRETPISPSVSTPNISICSSVTKFDNLNSYCVVDSKLKSQDSILTNMQKQDIHTVTTSGQEQCTCVPDIRFSSNSHPSKDKACYSPSYSLKSIANYHNTSQDINAQKTKAVSGSQENNCNASPLKNVYFSHFESENVNSIPTKNFEKNNDSQFRFENSGTHDVNRTKNVHHSSINFPPHSSYSSKKYDFQGAREICDMNSNYNISAREKINETILTSESSRQSNYAIKHETNIHSDCKFQKSSSKKFSNVHVFENRHKDTGNISTSVMHPKIEPKDKCFYPSCSTIAQNCLVNSYTNSGTLVMPKDLSPDSKSNSNYQNVICHNSYPIAHHWSYHGLPLMNPEGNFKAPEASKPPVTGSSPTNLSLHDNISVAQTAPQEIEMLRNSGTLSRGISGCAHPKKKIIEETKPDTDDEIQVISVQTKNISKSNSRRNVEMRPYQTQPLCLKNESDTPPRLSPAEIKTKSPSLDQQRKSVLQMKSEPKYSSTENLEEKNIAEKENQIIIDKNDNIEMKTNIKSPEISAPKLDACIIKDVKPNFEPIELDSKPFLIKNEPSLEPDSLISDEPPVLQHCNQNNNLKLDQKDPNQNYSQNNDIPENLFECKSQNSPPVLEANEKDLLNTNVPITDINENHGLHLLLDTIEKITLFKKVEQGTQNEQQKETSKSEQINSYKPISCSFTSIPPKRHGLHVLSYIAGERFVSEFNNAQVTDDDQNKIKSNYPDINETSLSKIKEKSLNEETSKFSLINKPLNTTVKSPIYEIKDKLVELQKKYLQKQKELSRLKPKKRLANNYLKGGQKKSNNDEPLNSENHTNTPPSGINNTASEGSSQNISNEGNSETCVIKNEDQDTTDKAVRKKLRESSIKCRNSSKKQYSDKAASKTSLKRKAKSSLSWVKTRSSSENELESPKKITRNSLNKSTQLKNKKTTGKFSENTETEELKDFSNKDSLKKTIDDESEKPKTYRLRKSSYNSNKKFDLSSSLLKSTSKTMSSKRKSDNPKKYMPSKQNKLSETIIAKHLRSRILFDTSGSLSDDDNQKESGVPDDLYDALMNCNLGEKHKSCTRHLLTKCNCASRKSKKSLGVPEPSKLNPKHLVINQRLLALEDGLFYAGSIKEIQDDDKYGITLDGQRGHKLHTFTREELLTQTIVESKPISSELPEGTRVCAYWSQQYRCLYPGIIGTAPCPSADWSEPRVFVLFDDGDSGQIPIKNVRLLPSDIQLFDESQQGHSTDSDHSKNTREKRGRLRSSSTRKHKKQKTDTCNETESKESSCTSINDSSCDESCCNDSSMSPSQNSENQNSTGSDSSPSNSGSTKLEKRLCKRTKHKGGEHGENEMEFVDKSDTKIKRHKKYKEKHRHHHHHHHHHHRHHHHHHHSKKHKHKKKNNGRNVLTQDFNNEDVIPCISTQKCDKNLHTDENASINNTGHSTSDNLPQNIIDID